jgi:MGT family glycosyltransferase
MARILIAVPPLAGHINPAVSVAAELSRRRHEVAWALHTDLLPDGLLPADAEVHALPAQSVADLGGRSATVRGLESVRFFYEDFCLPLARASLPVLEEVARRIRPDLILCDHQMLAGSLVARGLGIPWLTLASTNISILKMSPAIDAWVEGKLAELQSEYRLPVVPRPDFSPYGVVVFSSEALPAGKYPFYDARYRFVGTAFTHRQMSVEFPWTELRRDSAKLLVSLGTVSRDRSGRFYDIMLEALGGMELSDTYLPYRTLQVVLVAPDEVRRMAPPNFIVRSRVPQITLLAHMDGVLCHAGHNTVCEALSFGLPLIVAPIRDDQPIVARQVIDAGAALYLRYGKFSVHSARAAVLELFRQPAYRDNALRLQESFKQLRGAAQAADLVDELLQSPEATARMGQDTPETGERRALG